MFGYQDLYVICFLLSTDHIFCTVVLLLYNLQFYK